MSSALQTSLLKSGYAAVASKRTLAEVALRHSKVARVVAFARRYVC